MRSITGIWIIALATMFSDYAGGQNLHLNLQHSHIEFIDHGTVSGRIWYRYVDFFWLCGQTKTNTRDGNKIVLGIVRSKTGLSADGSDYLSDGTYCVWQNSDLFELGTFASGRYEITVQILWPDGSVFESATQTMHVGKMGGRCNPLPGAAPMFVMHPDGFSPALVSRIQQDSLVAAEFADPQRVEYYVYEPGPGDEDFYSATYELQFQYEPLFDRSTAFERIVREYPSLPEYRGGMVCYTAAGQSVVKGVREYFNAVLGNYFYSGDESEIALIAAGGAGPGWIETGKHFRAETYPNCTSGQSVVYRFYGKPEVGPNSHFFTQDPQECSVVNKSGAWKFEGVAFWASKPDTDGTCDSLFYLGTKRVPLYRAWRPFGDSNHRFTTDQAVVAEMVDKGWIDEGAVMCVLPPA